MKIASYWVFLASLFCQISQAQTLSSKIDTLINQQLPHATVGIYVKDAKTGQVIYSKNADTLLSPASNTKLFTAAAALYQLHPQYQYLTTLSQKKGNIYLRFSGSPALTSEDLQHLLLKLKEQGVKTISGHIILDGSRFQPPYYPPDFSYEDLGWYYAAPSTAIILNENAKDYKFISAEKIGGPIQIKAKKDGQELRIINQVITVSKEQEKEHCNLNIDIQTHNTLRLYGCLAQHKQPLLMQLAVPDPTLLAKQIIKQALVKNGIVLKGSIIEGKTPVDAQIIASHQSAPLDRLITHFLQESDNLYGDSITKELGYALTREGTYKQGVFAIKKILAEHSHLDMTQVELADGIGGRYNLTTAKQIVVLLLDLYHDKDMQAIFMNALPQAGVSGSLKARMKKTNLEGKVYAKTGTMHDISSLSGYMIDQKDRTLIFSIMINGINKPISTAKTLEEQILLLLQGLH